MLALASPVPGWMTAANPANVGDLTGNLPWYVWLLIPIAIVFALLTALALGSLAVPRPTERRTGGVSRALRDQPPSPSD